MHDALSHPFNLVDCVFPGLGAGQEEAELVKDDLSVAWELEQRLIPVVVDMTNRGMAFDIDSARKAKYAIEQRLDAARCKALTWFGLPDLNLDSPEQLLKASRTVSNSGTFPRRTRKEAGDR